VRPGDRLPNGQIVTPDCGIVACLKAVKDIYNNAEYTTVTDPMNSDKSNPVFHVAYGYSVQVVEIDKNGKVIQVTVASDTGRVVNPKAASGQIEGGVIMGLGYAFTEDFPVVDGFPPTKFGKLGLWRATQVPPIKTIFVQGEKPINIAYGAKGCGEIATIPTAPAVAGAYYKLDGKIRNKLPMSDTFYKRF